MLEDPEPDPPAEPDPYAVPEAELGDGAAPALAQRDVKRVRRRYGVQEVTIRHLGAAYICVGIALFLQFGVSLVTFQRFATGDQERLVAMVVFGAMTFAALLVGLSGVGLCRLNPVARWTAVAGAVFLLLVCPCGTWLSIYALIVLFSKSTATVFSDDYADVIAATRRMRLSAPGGTLIVLWTPAVLVVGSSLVGVYRFASMR